MLRSIAVLGFAVLLTACGGSTGSGTIPITGKETITFDSSAGRNGVPACPAADGDVYETTIVVALATGSATRTIAKVDCAAFTDPSAALPTTSQTTTVTATASQLATLTDAIRALAPYTADGCGEDGDSVFMTIDRDGDDVVYGDDEGAHCPPVKEIVSTASMTQVFTLAAAPF